MSFRYKLSICMMVKDEEQNIRRCLDSLKPLIAHEQVELIVVDTGSTDATVDIVREYTDKVYFHKWNNNFSEMRNITISYAAGEWLLIIDADEVLKDPEELLALLFSDKLDGYHTVEFKVKSFHSLGNRNKYGVSNLVRMFRNEEGFRYEGVVHNQPRFKKPILNTNIYLEHFGYLNDDRELMERKFKRTATLLKDELAKDPQNLYYQFQLAVSYSMYGDKRNALAEIRKAFALVKKRPFKERRFFAFIYGAYVRILMSNGKIKETVRICREGIKLQSDYVDLYFSLALALQRMGEQAEAVEIFKKYLKLVEEYHQLPIAGDPAYTVYNLDGVSTSHAATSILNYYIDEGDYEEALKQLSLVEDEYQQALFMIKILVEQKKYGELKEYYASIKDKKELARHFLTNLELYKAKLSQETRLGLEEAFAEGEGPYARLNQVRIAPEETRGLLVRELVPNLEWNTSPSFYGEILGVLLPDIRRFISTAKRINSSKLKEYLEYLLNKERSARIYLREYLLKANIRPGDLQGARVYKVIANVILQDGIQKCNQEEKKLDEDYLFIFRKYMEYGINYIRNLYQAKKLRLVYKMLENKEDTFLIALSFYQEAMEQKNFKLAAKYLKEAVTAYPCLAKAVRDSGDFLNFD